jgi:hypothetical protein
VEKEKGDLPHHCLSILRQAWAWKMSGIPPIRVMDTAKELITPEATRRSIAAATSA